MKRKIRVYLSIIVFLVIANLTACGNSSVGTPDPEKEPAPDAFELADIINENSNIELKLLSKAGDSEGNEFSSGGLEDMVTVNSYNGEVKAYAFPYPDDSDTVYWTQIYVENETNDLLGIHIGDDISDIIPIMEKYGYAFNESTDRVYSSKDADHIEIYRQGDVYFSFYMKGDTLVYMLVSVHEDHTDSDKCE